MTCLPLREMVLDPEAESIARHQAALWRYLRFLGCPRDLAEDLLQETLLAGLGADVIAGRPDEVVAAWLRTTARNLYFKQLRRRWPRQVDLDEIEAGWQTVAGDDGGEAHCLALRECLRELDGRARQALELRYRDEASREEMAGTLGIKPEGVKSLLQRLRRRLKKCIEARRRLS